MKRTEDEIKMDWEWIIPKLPKKHMGFLVTLNPEMIEEKREKVVRLSELPDLSRPDIKDEIEEVMGRLKKFGHRAYFIDKSHGELGIPVCRLFIPGFRSVVVSETYDPWFLLSEVCFEAGDEANSEKYLKKSLLRMSFYLPRNMPSVKPRQIYKKNYRETLLSYGGFKKDVYAQLKKNYPALPAAKP
jgi:hypothetical protein